MTTIQELQPQLLALSTQEKAMVIQLLASSISNTWEGISKTPGVMGGEACIRKTRIPVWLLVSLRTEGATDAHLIDNYVGLTTVDLTNAWLYAAAHEQEISDVIARQEAA
jgi:uncharacterized protein (DUF433 family)